MGDAFSMMPAHHFPPATAAPLLHLHGRPHLCACTPSTVTAARATLASCTVHYRCRFHWVPSCVLAAFGSAVCQSHAMVGHLVGFDLHLFIVCSFLFLLFIPPFLLVCTTDYCSRHYDVPFLPYVCLPTYLCCSLPLVYIPGVSGFCCIFAVSTCLFLLWISPVVRDVVPELHRSTVLFCGTTGHFPLFVTLPRPWRYHFLPRWIPFV